jgi:hypothetical protein
MMSAMRDEAIYRDPNVFDIRRTGRPKVHPIFGFGAHRCLGEALARAELEESLRAIAAEYLSFAWIRHRRSRAIWGFVASMVPRESSRSRDIARRSAGTTARITTVSRCVHVFLGRFQEGIGSVQCQAPADEVEMNELHF